MEVGDFGFFSGSVKPRNGGRVLVCADHRDLSTREIALLARTRTHGNARLRLIAHHDEATSGLIVGQEKDAAVRIVKNGKSKGDILGKVGVKRPVTVINYG